ncbi:MAG: hypothetical protein KAR35_08175 [Candidatus Heimdallarchaeota archaeon]|nr:hypothetical protein [Candidatus Heimdallarchaeota archaeon]MCK5049336.1 hypothetical protein [Candidatus Heimdallarchaeota archaeon]
MVCPLSDFSDVEVCVLTVLLHKNDLSNLELDKLSTMTERCGGCSSQGIKVSRGIQLLEDRGLLEREFVCGLARYHLFIEDLNDGVVEAITD